MDSISPDSPQKQCTICKQVFPATTEYFHAGEGRYGVLARCKTCIQKQRRKTPLPEPVPEGCKRCTKCKQVYPATREYFYYNRQMRDGLHYYCQACCKQPSKRLREGEMPVEKGMKRCTRCRKVFPLSPEHFHRKNAGWVSHCKECQSKLHRKYYTQHQEELIEYQRVYRIAHLEKVRSREITYYYSHLEECRARHRHYSKTHRESILATRWKNPLLHRLKRNARNHRRKARARNAIGYYTAQDVQNQLKRQKQKCYWCSSKLSTYHVDHIVPLARGGSNDKDNIVISCPACNTSRQDRLPHEWPRGERLL